MRMLFVGGTRFVGRAMAEAAVADGHEVTVLHRGRTNPNALPSVEHLTADRDTDLSVLAGREYDATVDVCAYVPRHVTTLAEALGGRGGHHVLVSTVSVYADTDGPGLTEDGPLVEPPPADTEEVTGETYGGLKVLCERAATASYAEDSLTILRPTYVVGPKDYTYRFPYWVERIAAGGEVLAPGPAASPVQLVDARDMGSWAVGLARSGTAGIFNGIGTGLPFGFADMLEAIVAAVGPAGTRLSWIEGAALKGQGITAQELPLWSEGEDEWVLAASNARARATGFMARPLADTVTDTLAWLEAVGGVPETAGTLLRERELELLLDRPSGLGV